MDWVCSSCGRHFNWSVSECPHCRFQTTVTTSGTQPTDKQQLKAEIAALERRASGFIGSTDAINILKVVLEELRQLSAV